MSTLDLCSRGPDFFHFLKVQTFESAIEAFIRFEYLLLFFAHDSLTQKTLRFEYFSRQDAKKPLLTGDHRRNEFFIHLCYLRSTWKESILFPLPPLRALRLCAR